jgi:nitrate/nitrite transporter NarK
VEDIMADRRYSGRSWPQATRGDPPGRRLGAIAGVVAAVFALAAVVLVVLTAVLGSTVETTAYSAVAALLFGLLAISAVRERSEARRRASEQRSRDGVD